MRSYRRFDWLTRVHALSCNKARFSTYIMKGIKKLVLYVYGVIMKLGNVERILEKPVKHEATPCVLQSSPVFSQHFPRALSPHKRTRLVFHFLNRGFSLSPFIIGKLHCLGSHGI